MCDMYTVYNIYKNSMYVYVYNIYIYIHFLIIYAYLKSPKMCCQLYVCWSEGIWPCMFQCVRMIYIYHVICPIYMISSHDICIFGFVYLLM